MDSENCEPTAQPLQPGDVCYLIKDEQDIELIPAGTMVVLHALRNGNIGTINIWSCRGVVNGVERPLLVFARNLTKEKPAEHSQLTTKQIDDFARNNFKKRKLTFWQKIHTAWRFWIG